jgi:hypothetical protein
VTGVPENSEFSGCSFHEKLHQRADFAWSPLNIEANLVFAPPEDWLEIIYVKDGTACGPNRNDVFIQT